MVIRHRWSHSAEEVNWGAAFGRTWHGNDVDSCAREDSGLRRPGVRWCRRMIVGYGFYAMRDTPPPIRGSPL